MVLFILVQTLSYDYFIESFLSKDTNQFYLTDDTGIMWRITKTLVRSHKGMHYIIGGGWNKYCQLRHLKEGSGVKIGAPNKEKKWVVICDSKSVISYCKNNCTIYLIPVNFILAQVYSFCWITVLIVRQLCNRWRSIFELLIYFELRSHRNLDKFSLTCIRVCMKHISVLLNI